MKTIVTTLLLAGMALQPMASVAAPDGRCAATLTQQGAAFNLHVPIAIPLLASTTTPPPVYWGDFTVTPVAGGGLGSTLTAVGVSSELPPFNCQAATVSTDATGNNTVTIPLINATIANSAAASYSATLTQQAGTNNFAVTQVGAAAPPSLPPTGAISCVGVTHNGNSSIIKICATFTNVPGSEAINLARNITAGTATWAGTSYFYNQDTANNNLTKVCIGYNINSYGYYSGMMGLSTDGGNVVLPWEINVSSTPQACN